MIYSKDVKFPFIGCPINFTMPLDSAMYQEQFKYTNSLIDNQLVQIMISQELYDSSKELYMLSEDRDGNSTRYSFQKNKLSDSYYYAICVLLIGGSEKYVNFKLYSDDGTDIDLLADSNWYYVNPRYDDNLKTIRCYNSINDFNVVFNEALDTIKYPIYGRPDIEASIVYSTIEGAFILNINTSESSNIAVSIQDENGDELFGENRAYNLLPETLIDTETLADKKCKMIISIGSDTICDSLYYLYDSKFTRTNTFNLDIECGFLPSDSTLRDEQNDFQQQNYNNKIVFSRPYIERVLTIGSKLGINKFTYYRLGHFLGCNNFYIGSVRFYRAKDSDIELISDTYQGLGFYKVNLQADNTFSQEDGLSGRIFNYTYNNTFN